MASSNIGNKSDNDGGDGAPPPKKRTKAASGMGGTDDDADRVVTLDVGDTIFKTNRSTLTSSSAYFKAMFSAEWNKRTMKKENQDIDKENVAAIFLDHDPSVFATLLSFMRYGSNGAAKVTLDVGRISQSR
jgi:BTB/POZ domain